ncbi:uncharacterized protein LOC122083175 [Macadamia integrifolia]|uniref:uncharacterized protein LOC122083175 n=1 Tax=Macadamia integrifolia TaxID=60698 RepID=UPI001C4F5924|nr:uncharacterized protein LOC122083175 [Macadamia integrifolia]
MSWSSSDNFFVNAKFEVFSVDLFSEPLELTQSKAAIYDGPKGDDFKRFLRSKNFRINRQGKVIVRIQKRDDDGEFLESQYDNFVLETVVPLGPFDFQNVPLLKPQLVNELQSLLDNTKAELVKKNDELNKLQSLLDNTKAELAKQNDAFDELRSLLDNTKAVLVKKNDALNELMKRKIEQDWNPEQFRLTIIAITNSMKKVFLDFGLEPPASEDPEFVLRMLHDLILHKEFGATFLVVANRVLASIGSIFEKQSGLSIGLDTTTSTPARLIDSLFTLKCFMDSHFFIDGSVIVKDFRLMNEDDLPAIFRDSAADVAELKQKKIGTKSIDNIDGNSIFYGYFNIPMVGMFKGVLTRVHVNLPDEIMVKLRVSGKHNLEEKRFWFVYANGSAIFQKDPGEFSDDLQVVKFTPSRVLGERTNFFEFLRRMNRTFVNEKGTYLKFEFKTVNFSEPKYVFYDSIGYIDKDFIMSDPFKLVQFDTNARPTDIESRRVLLPSGGGRTLSSNASDWIVNGALGNDCAFTFKDFCFIGKITRVFDTFRDNALVTIFFEQSQHGERCYVDALATTFFLLNKEEIPLYKTNGKVAPKFIL